MRTTEFDLELMVRIRLSGGPDASYSALGRRFNRDHTTILYHCRRLGLPQINTKRHILQLKNLPLQSSVSIYVINQKPPPPPKPKYADLFDEPKNAGKSYKEYLKESLARPVEKRYFKTYYETNFTPDKKSRTPAIAPYNEEERGEYYA